MVSPPIDWTVSESVEKPSTLSDIYGGYLSQPTGDIYHRYRLLTSHDYSHFNIYLGEKYRELLNVMNALQSLPFMINREMLSFIQNHRDSLEEFGLLMPSFLASLNQKKALNILRKSYEEDESIKNLTTIPSLFQSLLKRIQRARCESFILSLASAYDGYNFYLPAFLDFRGRIYRSGILHFHERDLARCLILFTNQNQKTSSEDCRRVLSTAAPFLYQSFSTTKESYQWYDNKRSIFNTSDYSLIQFAQNAKNPFQFIANVLAIERNETNPATVPVTQDASASAYQIMSYLLLDLDLAKRTNLIPSSSKNKIRDIYSEILEELIFFLHKNLDPTITELVCSRINRKLIKAIFMPLIYGKTIIGITTDIKGVLSSVLTHKECVDVAKVCMMFWKERYPHLVNLIKLISNIGWFFSSLNRPIYYSVPMYTTVQDYMSLNPVNIWIYDCLNKKRCKVTLRTPTQKRNRRKSEVATFVNFIHQKDAHIAMNVVIETYKKFRTSLYTVHDNFITTATYANELVRIYSDVFKELNAPLVVINKLIYENLNETLISKVLDINDIESIISNIKEFLDWNVKDPIPINQLKEIFFYLIPKSISKKERGNWEKRITGILTAYEDYVSTVCRRNNIIMRCGVVHDMNWCNFNHQIGSQNSLCLSY